MAVVKKRKDIYDKKTDWKPVYPYTVVSRTRGLFAPFSFDFSPEHPVSNG